MSYLKKGLGFHEEIIKTCTNLREFNRCIEGILSLHFTYIILKGNNSHISRKGDSTILGENRTNQKILVDI